MKTLGQRVDELIERFEREGKLQAEENRPGQPRMGNPEIFGKGRSELIAKIEKILDEYEF